MTEMMKCALEQSNNVPGVTFYFTTKLTSVFSSLHATA
jgi:hypothetical protein